MVTTSVSWESRRKLRDLTLSRTPGSAPRPCPLAQIYHRYRCPIIQRRHSPARPPAPTHLRQRPQSNCSPTWPAPPRRRLLCSRCLPELLHAASNCSLAWPAPLCRHCLLYSRLLHAATSSATRADGSRHHRPGRLLWTPPAT
jgi:hypothetical protein